MRKRALIVANRIRMVLVMPAAWVLLEWVRGTIFTGFPWLTLGYAHSGSPLAGYAPLLGVYGVSLVAAISAGLLAWLTMQERGVIPLSLHLQKKRGTGSIAGAACSCH